MLVVISTSAVPAGLRGELTRWLLEISAGTFVGNVSARVRDELWAMCTEQAGNGSVLLVHSARREQRLDFRSHGTKWMPVDMDGLTLMLRPEQPLAPKSSAGWEGKPASPDIPTSTKRRKEDIPAGWSIASRRRRFRTPIERKASKTNQSQPLSFNDGNLPEDPEF
ncbi:type I-E CRISPR-associated endoribonuclease Cas2e [Actinomycetaceae bacterium L2_0104]